MEDQKSNSKISVSEAESKLYDGDMELAVISTMLLKNGEAIPSVAEILNAEDFYHTDAQLVYSIILSLHDRGVTPSLLSIKDEIYKKFSTAEDRKFLLEYALQLGSCNGAGEFESYTNAYTVDYARRLKEKSTRRTYIDLAKRLKKAAENPSLGTDFLTETLRELQATYNDQQSLGKPKIGREFFVNHLFGEIDSLTKYATRKTGFVNVDEVQIFAPGLYVIGATPSAGKTTFCWQLLNQLAESGETCLFCSYEMSELELYAKSIARTGFYRFGDKALTSTQIRTGVTSQQLVETIEGIEQGNLLDNISVLELRDETIDELLNHLQTYCNGRAKSPIVCIDYLQIIPPSSDKKLTTDKARIDDIVRKLKNFQRETNTTFVVISSFNRGNYTQQVAFESFKESGNIEYSADVVWAMQLDVVNHFQLGEGVSATRKKVELAKKEQPRKIQVKCLKNRHGETYELYFNYFSRYDFFEAVGGFADDSDDDSAETRSNTNATEPHTTAGGKEDFDVKKEG